MATQKKKGPQVSRPPKAEERSRSIPRAEGRAKSIVKLEGRGRSIPKEVLNEEAEPKVEEIPPTITIQINEKKAILPNGKVSGIATVKAETDKVTRGKKWILILVIQLVGNLSQCYSLGILLQALLQVVLDRLSLNLRDH